MKKGRGRPRAADTEEVTIEFLLTKEFFSKEDFSNHIRMLAKERHVTCFEALSDYVEERGMDPAAVAKMLSSEFVEELEVYARGLRLLK
jgi:hypothetical protein